MGFIYTCGGFGGLWLYFPVTNTFYSSLSTEHITLQH